MQVDPADLLESMYRGEAQLGIDGSRHKIDGITQVSSEAGDFLLQTHSELRPSLSVEIGMAYGFSTIHILTAIRHSGYGKHIAIDPFQSSYWHGIGVTGTKLIGMSDHFRLMEEKSALALPRLFTEGAKASFIFIDGAHNFDNVIVDFFLSDLICEANGVVIFDDTWLSSVQKAVSFVSNNRADYRLLSSPIENFAIFRKIGVDRRDWKHYVNF